MYYLIIGPTCTGKDRIARHISTKYKNFKILVSTTSRPIRPGETDGDEYYFISRDKFVSMIENKEFIEYRSYETTVDGVVDTWYYGLEKSKADNGDINYIIVIDYEGAKEFQEYVGEENTVMIYIQSTYKDRYVRNLIRGDFNRHEWLRRNKKDSGWLMKALKEADYVIKNYGFDFPANNIVSDHLKIDIATTEVSDQYCFEQTKKQIDHIIKLESKK